MPYFQLMFLRGSLPEQTIEVMQWTGVLSHGRRRDLKVAYYYFRWRERLRLNCMPGNRGIRRLDWLRTNRQLGAGREHGRQYK